MHCSRYKRSVTTLLSTLKANRSRLLEIHKSCEGYFTHTVLPTPGHRHCVDCAAELAWGSDTALLLGFPPAALFVLHPFVFPLLLFSKQNEVKQRWLKRKNVPKVRTLIQLFPTKVAMLPWQILISFDLGFLTCHK